MYKIYLTTHKEDYIWHKIKPHPCLTQKSSCKRLSIPKFIRKKCKKIFFYNPPFKF